MTSFDDVIFVSIRFNHIQHVIDVYEICLIFTCQTDRHMLKLIRQIRNLFYIEKHPCCFNPRECVSLIQKLTFGFGDFKTKN